MVKLEDLKPKAIIKGILPDSQVTVVSVQQYGSEALELTYKDSTGRVGNQLLYRHDDLGASTAMAHYSAWYPRLNGSAWPTFSIQY